MQSSNAPVAPIELFCPAGAAFAAQTIVLSPKQYSSDAPATHVKPDKFKLAPPISEIAAAVQESVVSSSTSAHHSLFHSDENGERLRLYFRVRFAAHTDGSLTVSASCAAFAVSCPGPRASQVSSPAFWFVFYISLQMHTALGRRRTFFGELCACHLAVSAVTVVRVLIFDFQRSAHASAGSQRVSVARRRSERERQLERLGVAPPCCRRKRAAWQTQPAAGLP